MILDITAIKDYKDIKNIQNLSINLDMSKLIILLDGSSETSAQEYISGLISMGIYNFTKNKDGIVYLLSHPNIKMLLICIWLTQKMKLVEVN